MTSSPASRRLGLALWCALGLLYLAHNDLWLWDDGSLWSLFGVPLLPAGLAYHLLFCLAAAGLFALLVRFAWTPPEDEDLEAGALDRRGTGEHRTGEPGGGSR